MDFINAKPTICLGPEPQKVLQAKAKCEKDVRFIHVNHKVAKVCAGVCICLTVAAVCVQLFYLHKFRMDPEQDDDAGFYFLSALQKML